MEKHVKSLLILLASLLVGCAAPTAGGLPASTSPGHRTHAAQPVTWPAVHDDSPDPHCIFGEPRYLKDDSTHTLVRHYAAFTVDYDDKVLSPRWTAVKLTANMTDAHGEIDRDASRFQTFKTDPELKNHNLLTTKHADYRNLPGKRTWDRGHMVQFDDARGWGEQCALDSFLTTNICPQLAALNAQGWLSLEETVTEFARDYDRVWVYTGPVYAKSPRPFLAGRKIPKPKSFYKIVVRKGDNNTVQALAFVVPHLPLDNDADLSQFLESVDTVERLTGIDFLSDLPDQVEEDVEKEVGELWPDLPDN
jgi:endonuclease G